MVALPTISVAALLYPLKSSISQNYTPSFVHNFTTSNGGQSDMPAVKEKKGGMKGEAILLHKLVGLRCQDLTQMVSLEITGWTEEGERGRERETLVELDRSLNPLSLG
jgi:hypothetical protein